MSGPYCETCKHYYRPPLTDPDSGECGDPSKRVYDRNGNCVIEGPSVHRRYTCSNHTIRQTANVSSAVTGAVAETPKSDSDATD